MGENNNNSKSIKVPKSVAWGIVAFLVITPIAAFGSKLYEQGYEIVRHEERIKTIEENYRKIEKKLEKILDTINDIARKRGDDGWRGEDGRRNRVR